VRRGLGGLVVGNEYDTSLYGEYEGIPTYFCLYDQSRDFDFFLNDYLERKGWGVRMFSVLRPLSGLLIQKILARRYPHVLPFQMSCHRAHSEGGRLLPCGTCEKCIGVMATLRAFGEDATVCGYSAQQIERCLRDLPEKGTWQEPAALQHLAFLLSEQGHLGEARVGGQPAVRRPEMMKLRFDDEAASVSDLPADLRRPLLSLLLEEAEGAVWRGDDEWSEIDPLKE
jgi:hypothetical protein